MIRTLSEHLLEFRERYNSMKCLVEDDYVIYIFKSYYNAYKACNEANYLIEQMKLPLVAIHGGSNSFFIVQSNQTEA